MSTDYSDEAIDEFFGISSQSTPNKPASILSINQQTIQTKKQAGVSDDDVIAIDDDTSNEQSIDHSNNQSNNQSNKLSDKRSNNQSSNQTNKSSPNSFFDLMKKRKHTDQTKYAAKSSVGKLLSRSPNRSPNQSINQSNNQSDNQSNNQSIDQSNNQSAIVLDSTAIDSLIAPQPYYDLETMRDYNQAIDGNEGAVKRLKLVDKSSKPSKRTINQSNNQSNDEPPDSRPGWVKLPTYALVDEGIHGPMVSDHMSHKLHYDGYWESRMNKLHSQKPMTGIYETLDTWQANDLPSDNQSIKQSSNQTNDQTTNSPTNKQSSRIQSGNQSGTQSNNPSNNQSNNQSNTIPQIFRDTCFYFNGRTAGSDELSAPALTPLIRLYGGQVTAVLSRTHVTHIVATNLNRSKFDQEFVQRFGGASHRPRNTTALSSKGITSKSGLIIVKPEFIKACVQVGRLLDTKPFEFVLDRTQSTLGFTPSNEDDPIVL